MRKQLDIQQENIKKLIELVQENPTLRILPLVDTDCCLDDSYGSWVAEWGKAEVDEIWAYEGSERIYCKSDDYDELIDEAMDEIAESGIREFAYDLDNLAKAKVDAYEWEKVIIVRINQA